MGDRLRAGISSRYVTSQLGRLSLASLRGRLIEYQLWLGQRRECQLCRVAELCDPIWHTSSRSGEACCELLYSVYLTFTLPAFAAERSVGACSYQSISVADDGARAANPPVAIAAVDGWDRQTDARPLHRPCSTYCAGSINNTKLRGTQSDHTSRQNERYSCIRITKKLLLYL